MLKFFISTFLFIAINSSFIFAFQDSALVDPDLRLVIESTLSKNPNIKIQEQSVSIAEGNLRTSFGIFDPVLNFGLGFNRGYSPEYINSVLMNPLITTTSYSAGLSKLFGWGGTMSFLLQMTRSEDTLQFRLPPNTASVILQLEIPLLQGMGVSVTSADELSSGYLKQAESKEYLFTVSQEVLGSVQNYWQYIATFQSYDEIKKSLSDAENFYEENKILAESKNIPGSNLIPLLATISQKKIDLLNARQSVYSAKQMLANSMGLSLEESNQLTLSGTKILSDDWLPDSNFIMTLPLNLLTSLALKNRQDYLANTDRVTASEFLVKKAENNTLSELNLTLNAGYTGVTEGKRFEELFSPFYKNIEGMNFGATLSYSIPLRNNSAKGELISTSSQYLQNKISAIESERQIISSVAVALRELQSNYLGYIESKKNIELNETAVENEKIKLKLGSSDLINVDYLERNLLTARLTHIQMQRNLANAILNLKFVTGTLVNSNGEVSLSDLTNLQIIR